MTDERRRVPYVRAVAVVGDFALIGGHPAWFLARLLDDMPGGLEAKLARFELPLERHFDILRAVDALRHGGAAWQLEHVEQITSTSGSDLRAGADSRVPSNRGTSTGSPPLSAKDVAGVLGVSSRWVRVLAGKGLLRGHRDPGRRWQFDSADVAAERERRRGERVKGRAAA